MNHSKSLQKKIYIPRIIFWETTSLCNLTCIHCRRLDISVEESALDLTTQAAENMIFQISSFAKPILVLSGGEPLIRKDIFRLAEYAVKNGLNTALATNGTLITQDVANQICKSGISRVSISLDGADAETHNTLRKIDGSFERAIEGIKFVRNVGISTQINCTISRLNVAQLKKLFELTKSLEVDALHLFFLVPVGCGVKVGESLSLSPQEYENALNEFINLSLKYNIQTRATCAPHFQRILRERLNNDSFSETEKEKIQGMLSKGCIAGQNACFISHKGEIFPCGYLPVICGDINKESFQQIWEESKIFKMLRDSDLLEGKCGVCEFKEICMGCRARAFFQTGSVMGEEPFCLHKPR